MKVTIKLADSSPVGAKPKRRVLGVLDVVLCSPGPLASYATSDSPVPIDGDSSIVPNVTYTPCNHVLSITVSYRADGQEKQIFGAVAEWLVAPPYFAFGLPTGKFIELQFEGDTTEPPNPALQATAAPPNTPTPYEA